MKLIPQSCPPPAFESFTSFFYFHSLINLNRWSTLKRSKAVEPNVAVIKRHRRIFQLCSHHCISYLWAILELLVAKCFLKVACHHLPDLSHTHLIKAETAALCPFSCENFAEPRPAWSLYVMPTCFCAARHGQTLLFPASRLQPVAS